MSFCRTLNSPGQQVNIVALLRYSAKRFAHVSSNGMILGHEEKPLHIKVALFVAIDFVVATDRLRRTEGVSDASLACR
jgi:hypothetical protein